MEIEDAKTRLDEVIARARAGEEIIIAHAGRPMARIVPMKGDGEGAIPGFGMFKGRIWMSDDFNDPLPEDELREWEK
ncbi:MAG TPA: type II toxin-antitoxin system prevent-host-death family antitoxin [Tepidisphaeraceae bacterium]|nr:type II toxin-antitoxin system prevent-host-death family antitoxin [Tepidisphaeraceae bacterium]